MDSNNMRPPLFVPTVAQLRDMAEQLPDAASCETGRLSYPRYLRERLLGRTDLHRIVTIHDDGRRSYHWEYSGPVRLT